LGFFEVVVWVLGVEGGFSVVAESFLFVQHFRVVFGALVVQLGWSEVVQQLCLLLVKWDPLAQVLPIFFG
jgi:hypothetical protein